MIASFKIIDILGKRPSYPNEIARRLSISPSQVQKWLLWLLDKKMVVRKKGDFRRMFYYINTTSHELCAYRKTILIEKLKQSKGWQKLCKITLCGIYGSFSQGTFDENSDIDLWVYLTIKNREKIREIANQLGDEFERVINLIYIDKKYLKNLKEKDPDFFYRLKLQSITQHPEVFNVT